MKLYTAPKDFLEGYNKFLEVYDRLSASIAFTGIYEKINKDNLGIYLTSNNQLERDIAKIYSNGFKLKSKKIDKIDGDLFFSNNFITCLPDNLKIDGSLDLYSTSIISLPNNLEVSGFLNLSYTYITSLPDNLKVGEYIWITKDQIKYCPERLKSKLIAY